MFTSSYLGNYWKRDTSRSCVAVDQNVAYEPNLVFDPIRPKLDPNVTISRKILDNFLKREIGCSTFTR